MFYVKKGHFYAVGVGPGSSDLITARGIEVLKNSDLILCPASARSAQSMALKIISPWLTGQKVKEIVYPMQRDAKATWSFWENIALEVAEECAQNKVVSQVTLGDPLFYSTSCYLLACLRDKMQPAHLHVVPGITAFQTVSAHFLLPMVMQEESLLLLPGTDLKRIEAALDHCETLVLYKVGKNLQLVLRLLKQRGLLAKSYLAAYIEQKNEHLVFAPREDLTLDGYLVTLIVKVKSRNWQTCAMD